MSAALTTLLAFAGTGFAALAVFAPQRERPTTVPRAPAMSFAPPPVATWHPPADEFVSFDQPPVSREPAEPAHWTLAVDAAAVACDLDARIALLDALADVGGAWALDIIADAAREDPDPQVRERAYALAEHATASPAAFR